MKFIEDMEKKSGPQASPWDIGFHKTIEVSKTTLQGIAAELHTKLVHIFDINRARDNIKTAAEKAKKLNSDNFSGETKRTQEEMDAWGSFRISG